MNKIISLMMVLGLLGANGVALAEETACAKVDAQGDLNIQCITVNDANHSVVLTHHPIPFPGHFTYDGGITDATVSQECATTDNDLTIKLPCVAYPSGTLNKITMTRVPDDMFEFLWVVSSTETIQKEWLFVHTAKEAVLSGSKLTIPAANDIFAFTDRPYRENTVLPPQDFVTFWSETRVNSFHVDPPNAVMTWAGDGGAMNTEEVVIEAAVFADDTITYDLRGIQNEVIGTHNLQSVSIFIDSIPNASYFPLHNLQPPYIIPGHTSKLFPF